MNSYQSGFEKWLFYFFCACILLFLILPVFVIIPISFSAEKFLQFPPKEFSLQWYEEFFNKPVWISATLLSFKIAILTMIFATFLGTLASLSLVRGKFKSKKIVYGALLSPLIMPFIIVAVSLYYFFAKINMIGSMWSLVLAHTVLALPFVVINVTASLQGLDITFERAAISLGANRLVTFIKVTFPLIRPGVISGALFAFITSFDEVVIAIFLSGSRSVTLPKQMWDGIRIAINPTISSVASLLIVFSILLLVSVEILRRHSAKKMIS
ncbi:MAG: ABC transporter permease [Deltaproteobacteria bacterium]|jgi:putative spermidine/putrescine transport system permease protein|nr:ABC transporter permease [Deltaproteobacteria bacterium]